MKWFKHFSDNYRGRSIDTLFEQMGHTGVACYFIIMEIFTEKMEIYDSKNLSKSDFILSFPLGFVRRNLRISQGKLEVFLRFSQGLGLFSYEIIGKELKIEMPILLDLLHSDVTKSRSRREQYKNGSGPELELKLNKDVDVKEKRPAPNIEKQEKEHSLNNKQQHFFEKFVFDELQTLDTGLTRYASKIDKAFINEIGFNDWVKSVVTSRSYKKIEAVEAKKRYFLSALKNEMKNRGVL